MEKKGRERRGRTLTRRKWKGKTRRKKLMTTKKKNTEIGERVKLEQLNGRTEDEKVKRVMMEKKSEEENRNSEKRKRRTVYNYY